MRAGLSISIIYMKKTSNLKFIIAILIVAVCGVGTIAYANPLYVGTKAQTATASSTLSYLTPGMATTTLVYDSYEQFGTNETNSGNQTIANSIALGIQGIGSSTATVINIACEFSDNGTDWYQNEIFPASTSNPLNIATPFSFTFTNASSTIGGIAFNGFKKIMQCPLPLRYVRAIITDTGSSTGIWATFIPTKQRN